MPGAIVHYRVACFDAFLKVFEQHAVMRKAAGIYHTRLCQVAGDPNHVYMDVECEDVAMLRVFCTSSELEHAMQLAGVITPPQVQFLDKVRSYPH